MKAQDTTIADLRELLAADDDSRTLFAVLDACDEPLVAPKVNELGSDRAVSLYRGWAERDYWAIAPYLVQVDTQLLDWIVENLWQTSWGIFAVAPVELPKLRTHFRRFLMVKDPDGKEMYFRYYDPRVLEPFLSTCTQDEVTQFFGPVGTFLLPAEGEQLRTLSL